MIGTVHARKTRERSGFRSRGTCHDQTNIEASGCSRSNLSLFFAFTLARLSERTSGSVPSKRARHLPTQLYCTDGLVHAGEPLREQPAGPDVSSIRRKLLRSDETVRERLPALDKIFVIENVAG
jgi:hypothetical protein